MLLFYIHFQYLQFLLTFHLSQKVTFLSHCLNKNHTLYVTQRVGRNIPRIYDHICCTALFV